MITQGLFGGLSSICFGTADFMGRFSSRAIDHHNALLSMMATGFVPLSARVLLTRGLPHLKEIIKPVQWLDTILVFAGVMVLPN